MLLALAQGAEAAGAVAVKIVNGSLITQMDLAPCTEAFRAALLAKPLWEMRRRAQELIDGIADAVHEVEDQDEACNDMQPDGRLCRLHLKHAPMLGHATWIPPEIDVGGFVSLRPEETGWIVEKHRAGVTIRLGPEWATRVLPRPLSIYPLAEALRVSISEPETFLRDVLEEVREVLGTETVSLVELGQRIACRMRLHGLTTGAVLMALLMRGELRGDFDAMRLAKPGEPEDAPALATGRAKGRGRGSAAQVDGRMGKLSPAQDRLFTAIALSGEQGIPIPRGAQRTAEILAGNDLRLIEPVEKSDRYKATAAGALFHAERSKPA